MADNATHVVALLGADAGARLHALVEDVGQGHVQEAAILEGLCRRTAQQHEALQDQALGTGDAWRIKGRARGQNA